MDTTRTSRGRLWLAVLVASAFGVGFPASATAQADSLPAELRPFRAQLTPIITAGADTSQRYALLLPARYPATRPSPLLLLMDPRGRALVPLARFAEAASRLGFVVMSSYNTQSDGPAEPNIAAANAMLADATRVLAVDRAGIFLAGFSGTARMAYLFATELPGVVRGVIAAGAGPAGARGPTAKALARDPAFAVFSTTGTADFNHDEVVAWDQVLAEAGVTRRTVVFDGGHQWMPSSLANEALEWLAFRRERERGDSSYRTRRLVAMDSVRRESDTLETARWLEQLARDFSGDSSVAAYLAEPAAVSISARARPLRERESRRMAEDREWTVRAERVLDNLRGDDRQMTAGRMAKPLEVDRLLAESNGPSPAERNSARRRLEWLTVNATFYAPRRYAATQSWREVILALEIGRLVRPLGPDACRTAAEALSRLGMAMDRYPECTA